MQDRMSRRAMDREPVDVTAAVIEVDGSVGMIDLWETMVRCWDLPTVMKIRRSAHPGARRPNLTVDRAGRSGCSDPEGSAGVHLTPGTAVSRESVEETLLHQVLHVAHPPGVHHDHPFRRSLLKAAGELWPGLEVPRNAGSAGDLDDKIIRAAKRLRRTT